jgi:hypothetical protein
MYCSARYNAKLSLLSQKIINHTKKKRKKWKIRQFPITDIKVGLPF